MPQNIKPPILVSFVAENWLRVFSRNAPLSLCIKVYAAYTMLEVLKMPHFHDPMRKMDISKISSLDLAV